LLVIINKYKYYLLYYQSFSWETLSGFRTPDRV
jgi:hypothetical protein